MNIFQQEFLDAATEALKDLGDNVRVYPSAGVRPCIQVWANNHMIELVSDVEHSGTLNDPYSVYGFGTVTIYSVSLEEAVSHVQETAEKVIHFLSSIPKRPYRDWASLGTRTALKDYLENGDRSVHVTLV